MTHRSFLWSRLFLIGLVASTAVLTVAGIAATYFQLGPEWDAALDGICAAAFAGIAGFALATSQMASAMAETLRGHAKHAAAFKLALLISVVCGLISLGGVHLAAVQLDLDWRLLDVGGFLLAFVKPAQSFVIEAARAASLADAEAAAMREAELETERMRERLASAERIAEARAPAPPPQITAPTVVSFNAEREKRRPKKKKGQARLAKAAAAAMAATAPLPAFADQPPAIVQDAAPLARPAGWKPSLDDLERASEELARRGINVSQRTLAAHMGCSRRQIRLAQGDPHA